MDAIPYSTLRSNLATQMDRVCEDHAPIIVTRKSCASVVMISLDDYESLEETSYLLRGPKNARRLLESITELGSGAGTQRERRVRIVFSEHAWDDYLYWQKTDRKVLQRVNTLIREVERAPFEGIGKPEPLKHALAGYWSRRINDEHRLVYKVDGDSILIAQARYHY